MCSWTWFWSSGEIIMSDINKDFVCQLQPILSRHDSTAYPYIVKNWRLVDLAWADFSSYLGLDHVKKWIVDDEM